MTPRTYLVITEQIDANKIDRREFDNLVTAYRFYLEDPAHRRIYREVEVDIKEKK